MRTLRTAAMVVSAIAVVSLSAFAQTDKPPAGNDPVVARVNEKEIRRSEILAAREALPQQYRDMPLSTIYPALMRQIIDTILVADAARAQGLADDPVVKQRLAQFETRILESVYLQRRVEDKLTDQALQKRYQDVARSGTGEKQIRARHILVESEAEATAVIAEIASGADFAELAQAKSKGPSRARGGDLGFFSRSDMVASFADAAFALEPGTVTMKPVKTRFGWHVIKVEEGRKSSIPTFEESRARLVQEMSQEIVAELVAGLRKGARIQQFKLDGTVDLPPGVRPFPQR